MIRCIDADKLRKDVLDLPNPYNGFSDTYDKAMILDLIDEQPIVDAEPVRRGHWIERTKVYPDLPNDSTYVYECSNCGYMDTHGANVEVPYCWHCGVDMREVEE